MEYEELLEEVSRRINIPKEVLEEKVKKMIRRCGGLITKRGALMLVLKENDWFEKCKDLF